MQVEELFDLTTWVEKKIAGAGIPDHYSLLHQILAHNAQQPQKQPFEEERVTLRSALSDVPLEELTQGQIDILRQIGIAEYVGNEGVQNIDTILLDNTLDLANAAQRIQEFMQSVSSGIEWSKASRNQIKHIINLPDVRQLSDSEVLIRIRFTHHAEIANVKDFKIWGNIWYEIARGIAMLHGKTPEDVRIVGASRGSIYIDLVAYFGFAKAVSAIMKDALAHTQSMLKIMKTYEEVRALKLDNKKAEQALKEDIKTAKAEGTKAITKNAIDSIVVPEKPDGGVVAALTKSIERLVTFLEKGGEVDFVMPDEPETDEDGEEDEKRDEQAAERQELRSQFEDVRKLESHVRVLQIDFNGDESPDEEEE